MERTQQRIEPTLTPRPAAQLCALCCSAAVTAVPSSGTALAWDYGVADPVLWVPVPCFHVRRVRLQESHEAEGDVVQSQAQPWLFVGEIALFRFNNNSNMSPGARNSQEGGSCACLSISRLLWCHG